MAEDTTLRQRIFHATSIDKLVVIWHCFFCIFSDGKWERVYRMDVFACVARVSRTSAKQNTLLANDNGSVVKQFITRRRQRNDDMSSSMWCVVAWDLTDKY